VSVPSPSETQATYAATLVDEWIKLGVLDAVVAPGSRSTPLVLALSSRDEVTLHVRIDERSAGFFAIGRSLVTGQPTLVVVTSGTAAAELHAAVAEADLAGVALIVVTADRPPELHGVGAPQTIDQQHLYGGMVRRFEDPGVASWDQRASWRGVAQRAYHSAHTVGAYGTTTLRRGPVHLNAPFVEPLVAAPRELPGPSRTAEPGAAALTAQARLVTEGNVLFVAGPGTGAQAASYIRQGAVVIGDATLNGATPYADPILRDDVVARRLRPDVVVRIGGLVASKVVAQRLREWSVPVLGMSDFDPVADPDRVVSERVPRVDWQPRGDGGAEYAMKWSRAVDAVEAVAARLDVDGELSEPAVARAVVAASERFDAALVIGSSMPIRDVEWWTPPRRRPTFANRGVNGIDGVTSTILGVAAGSRAIGYVGDVTFLHDVSALTDGVGDAGGSCALVVSDNGGGGIFSFLPQAEVLDDERFTRLFSTPRHLDPARIAEAFGHRSVRVKTLGELRSQLSSALDQPGLRVIVAEVPDVASNVMVHDRLNVDVNRATRDATA